MRSLQEIVHANNEAYSKAVKHSRQPLLTKVLGVYVNPANVTNIEPVQAGGCFVTFVGGQFTYVESHTADEVAALFG